MGGDPRRLEKVENAVHPSFSDRSRTSSSRACATGSANRQPAAWTWPPPAERGGERRHVEAFVRAQRDLRPARRRPQHGRDLHARKLARDLVDAVHVAFRSAQRGHQRLVQRDDGQLPAAVQLQPVVGGLFERGLHLAFGLEQQPVDFGKIDARLQQLCGAEMRLRPRA